MWKNMVDPNKPQMTINYGTCWITRATDTHLKYVIL